MYVPVLAFALKLLTLVLVLPHRSDEGALTLLLYIIYQSFRKKPVKALL